MTSKILTILVLFFFITVSFEGIAAKEVTHDDAEINAYIEKGGELPSIKVNQWSTINITILDTFSMDWSLFKEKFFNWSKPRPILFWNYFYWNYLFEKKLGRPIDCVLGFTSLLFTSEVISTEPIGWKVKITPNIIVNTTTGKKNFINLETIVEEAPADYSVIIRIKCTRLDTHGVEYGYSFIDIPLKAEPTDYITMNLKRTVGYSKVHNVTHFTIDLTNKGYYKDTFFVNFTHSEELFCNVDNQVLTLESGETKPLIFNVLTPDKIVDLGTPYLINVYVHSIGNDTNKLIGSYVLITKGIYFNPILSLVLFALFTMGIISYLIFIKYKRKRRKRW